MGLNFIFTTALGVGHDGAETQKGVHAAHLPAASAGVDCRCCRGHRHEAVSISKIGIGLTGELAGGAGDGAKACVFFTGRVRSQIDAPGVKSLNKSNEDLATGFMLRVAFDDFSRCRSAVF